ncbi:MAG: hypothetical protein ACRENG_20310 [bacterium]
MKTNSKTRNIQTRRELFDFLQSQMQTAYRELREKQRLEFESSLVKSYIFEVDLPADLSDSRKKQDRLKTFIEEVFGSVRNGNEQLTVEAKEEDGFYELSLNSREQELILYLDTMTNSRFWQGFSISNSQPLDVWLETITKTRSEFDFVWLWPSFLEAIQKRGLPCGFGLDYDYRKFEDGDSDTTTYLKMQLWGGSDTAELYNLLKGTPKFHDKIVLSKVRLKEFGDSNKDLFALQDIKYTGKFTARGTDFSTHTATLSFVRSEYEKKSVPLKTSMLSIGGNPNMVGLFLMVSPFTSYRTGLRYLLNSSLSVCSMVQGLFDCSVLRECLTIHRR